MLVYTSPDRHQLSIFKHLTSVCTTSTRKCYGSSLSLSFPIRNSVTHTILCPLPSCKLVCWTSIIFSRRTTLAKIQGPKWASWTRLWLVKMLASGDSASLFSVVNQKYGSLARIRTNNMLTNDPALPRRVLAVRSGCTRGP
ncbi:hypothetical protein BDR22DRAFT_145040 [Usnea florida]